MGTGDQAPLQLEPAKKLHGKFLHITDIHPDPGYIANTSAEELCHRGKKTHHKTGLYGLPNSNCDTPLSLVDATFEWIEDNLKDEIDFIIWTGDNSRHDNDVDFPRTESAIWDSNNYMVEKFMKTFGSKDPRKTFEIPIIPSLGNNDVYPHNLFAAGPSAQTRKLYQLWSSMVPEEQIHVFARGVTFMVEAIPDKLVVISLNTLYWFKSNNMVDGCKSKKDPGHLMFRWLAIVLKELRERNMKVWFSGHVPPSPKNYEISCLHRLSAWLHAYRDIIVGGVYGHLNLDHFLVMDSHDGKYNSVGTMMDAEIDNTEVDWDDNENEISIFNKLDYIEDLRKSYSKVKKDHTRYAIQYVGASVIPTYLPGLRVWEYNISGIDNVKQSKIHRPWSEVFDEIDKELESVALEDDYEDEEFLDYIEDFEIEAGKKKKKKNKKGKKGKKKDPTWPPVLDDVEFGPAYIPQTFSPLKYTQYFANITASNKGEEEFNYQIEYSTEDAPFNLPNLMVSSWVELARYLGEGLNLADTIPANDDVQNENDFVEDLTSTTTTTTTIDEEEESIKKTSKKLTGKDRLKKKKKSDAAWKDFVRFAFVSSGYENL